MALTVAEEVSESGPASNSFTSRTLSFGTPVPIGTRAVVLVDLYTSSGVQTTAGMISDPGGHTWTQVVGQTGDGSTGGVAILSTVAVSAITNITLTPGGSANYATWSIARLSGPADVDDSDVGSGSSAIPRPADMTATTTDGVALSVISTRNQSVDQTVPSGWTAIELEKDNSGNLAGAIAHSPNISSTGTVTVIWASADGGQWYAAGVLFKAAATLNHYTLTADGGTYSLTGAAATLVALRILSAASGTYALTGTAANLTVVPLVYMVMGGTETEGWFGHEGKGGADSTASITFPEPVPAGAAIVVPMSCYQFNPTLTEVSDDGGNTWVIDVQEACAIGGGEVGASVTLFRSILTNPCSVFAYDATALPAGDAGRYGQLGAYVFSTPDTVNGFFTTTPASNTQGSTTTVAPGTVTPDTNRSFGVFTGDNRGHTTDLKPYVKPTGYTDASLIHSEIDGDGAESAVHNSTTQSGWWFGKYITTYTPETPTFGFATATGGALSVFAIYNILGGVAGAVLEAEAGSYSVSGTAASLEYGRVLAANAGAYALTGTAASLEHGYRVSAESGTFALTGTAATVLAARTMAASAGSFAVSGTAVTVRVTRLVSVESASYVVTGQAAGLVYSGSAYILTADAGSYAVSGQAATLTRSHVMAATAGVLTATGTAATLTAARELDAATGTLTYSGQAALLVFGRRVVSDASSFSVSGTVATFARTYRAAAASAAYSVIGTDASLVTSAEAGLIARTRLSATYRPVHTLTATLEV
jgi:hypothetical protein